MLSKSAYNFLDIKFFAVKNCHLLDRTITYAFMKKKQEFRLKSLFGSPKNLTMRMTSPVCTGVCTC